MRSRRLPSFLVMALSVLALAACAALVVSEEPASDGAVFELQTGPVSFQFWGTTGPLAIEPTRCERGLCPILIVRLAGSSTPLQGSPLKAGRVEYLNGAVFNADGLITQTTYESLSEPRSMGKTPRTESAQNEQSGPI